MLLPVPISLSANPVATCISSHGSAQPPRSTICRVKHSDSRFESIRFPQNRKVRFDCRGLLVVGVCLPNHRSTDYRSGHDSHDHDTRARVDFVLRTCRGLTVTMTNYLKTEDADSTLFHKVTADSHVLHRLLPPLSHAPHRTSL